MEPEDPLARLSVHGQADGDDAVRAAERLVTRLQTLRGAGLGARECFWLLQTYSNGCVTHLLWTNYEDGDWLTRLDGTFVQAVEDLLGDVLDENQRAQCFLRLTDGGLGLASAAQTAAAAYLGSWALTLRSVGN